MDNQIYKLPFMKKVLVCIFFLVSNQYLFAQADLTLTINDFLNWSPSVINQSNISNTILSRREKSNNFQLISNVDTNAKILYSPDGMDNFGPYIDSSSQFNLFNFSHWQYIDILAWFGGSAGTPILIPSKAWVDAAHKNGVKVIGTIFFAPTVYGGTQAAVQSFLQKDINGNYIASSQLIAIANYYNFDGWIFNCETQINSSTGSDFSSFINQFDSSYNGEIIWYDAMLQNGSISYQNKLNANNAYFFQHSTGLFTNYSWSQATTVASSNTYALGLARSPFDVYTGADMWPNRTAQPAFSNYTWIDKIFPGGVAKTSIALFATNFTFNYGGFSTFNNDPADYASFYATERKIFSGNDETPFAIDNAWKGIGNYIAARTTITSLPFSTDFNTGHGLNYYSNGNVLSSGSWHNMSHQSILPTWTFYNSGINIDYDFNDAYNGGSSIILTSTTSTGFFTIPLYSTEIVAQTSGVIGKLAFKSSTAIDSIGIQLQKSNATFTNIYFHPIGNGTWENLLSSVVGIGSNDTIVAMNLLINSATPFTINLGGFEINSSVTGLNTLANENPPILQVYPNPSNGEISFSNLSNRDGKLSIFDLKGSEVKFESIISGKTSKLKLIRSAVYIYEFKTESGYKSGKIIIN